MGRRLQYCLIRCVFMILSFYTGVIRKLRDLTCVSKGRHRNLWMSTIRQLKSANSSDAIPKNIANCNTALSRSIHCKIRKNVKSL